MRERTVRGIAGHSIVAAVVVACAALLGLSAGEDESVDLNRLAEKFHEAYQAKDYAAALRIAEKMNDEQESTHPATLYNIAAMHSLLGNHEEAFEYLDRAVDAGFEDAWHMYKDEDFASIRKDPRFRQIFERIWIPQYLAMLERPEREEFQKPAQVMEALALQPGEKVADIGAGSGYFTLPVAKAVGPEGLVWAIDIRQQMIDYIEKRLEKENVTNVKLALVSKDDPQLSPGSIDTILMVDTIHYIQDRVPYIEKLRKGLAPGGRVVIIDYKPKPMEERPWGPPPSQQIARETLDAEFAQAGFKPAKVHDFLPEQYFVEYKVE